MLVTPETNVKNHVVIDDNKVEKKIISSDDTVDIYDIVKKENSTIKLIDISLYDHLIVLDGVQNYVLRALWKKEKI